MVVKNKHVSVPLVFKIFDYQIKSNVHLPELQQLVAPINFTHSNKCIDFSLEEYVTPETVVWYHRWHLANGSVSIECGRDGVLFYLRFPGAAIFSVNLVRNQIRCYPKIKNLSYLRHLLLDQVVPRYLYQKGEVITHCSSVKIGKTVALFLGESGDGKSTLAVSLAKQGGQLISDDCVLLRHKDRFINVISNYHGARLLEESAINLLDGDSGTLCGGKMRISGDVFGGEDAVITTTEHLSAIILAPSKRNDEISIVKMGGVQAMSELLKHSFPLDPTNIDHQKEKFVKLTDLLSNSKIHFYKLEYPHKFGLLNDIYRLLINRIG